MTTTNEEYCNIIKREYLELVNIRISGFANESFAHGSICIATEEEMLFRGFSVDKPQLVRHAIDDGLSG